MEQVASQQGNSALTQSSQYLRTGYLRVKPAEQTTHGHTSTSGQKGPELPGVAVGGQALPGLHTAAGHSKCSPTAAVQLHEQGLGSVLSCFPAVVSSLQHLSDVFFS